MALATPSVTWSAFQRDAKSVAEQADETDVRLRRRDGPDLFLGNAERHEAMLESLTLVARLFASLIDEPAVRSRLADATTVPWLHFLPPADRELFAQEFAATAAGSLELGTPAPLVELIREWRNTAMVHADPRLAAALRRDHAGDGGPVSAPSD